MPKKTCRTNLFEDLFMKLSGWMKAAAVVGCIMTSTIGATNSYALSQDQRHVVWQIEQVINTISTAQGRFMQITANGGIANGNIFISRPGRIRFEYDPPSPLMIVSDGKYVSQVDKDLESVYYKRLSKTPLNFILADRISLNKAVETKNVEFAGDSVLVTVQNRRNPSEGNLTMIFDNHTKELRAWQVMDPQGQLTTVRLESMSYGLPLDPYLFQRPQGYQAKNVRD
jgi:outer membrane lipoprotein-sorting protein